MKKRQRIIQEEEALPDKYGRGAGMLGNKEGEDEIEKALGLYTVKTKGAGLEKKVDSEGSPVKDISAKLAARPSAEDSDGGLVSYTREESLLTLLSVYGASISEASEEVLDLCAELLVDITDEHKFNIARNYMESFGVPGLPSWEESQGILAEVSVGSPGLGNDLSIAGIAHNSAASPRKRKVDGYKFYAPKPPSKVRQKAGERNAKVVSPRSGGMHSRMARARQMLATLPKEEQGVKGGARIRGIPGRDFRANESMQKARGKYEDINTGHIEMIEGYPHVSGGYPWFHGQCEQKLLGGVSTVVVDGVHALCYGSLPRPKLVENYTVWNTGRSLSSYDMEYSFAKLTEGYENVRTWAKRSRDGKTLTIGLPTEGVIVTATEGKLSFLDFESSSGAQALQEWAVYSCQKGGDLRAVQEAVTYGYSRMDTADLILDRVLRRLNRLNILDVFEDAVFDNADESLYVLLTPILEEAEVQDIALGLQTDYPDVQIIGGPLDESIDWWVLYVPRDGSQSSPHLDRVFAPQMTRPLTVQAPNIIGQAINQVAKLV